MKKTTALFCLLLALLMLLGTSCSLGQKPNNGNGTDDTDDSASDQSTPAVTSPDHIWYSQTNFTVVDLRDMPNITFYELQPGYNQYVRKLTGECTYEDNVITFTPEDGEELCWVFDVKKGALTMSGDGETHTYKTQTEIPTEFVWLSFPNYAEIDCSALVTLPNYREFTFSASVELFAKIELFDAYYATVTDATKREITGRTAQKGDYVCIDYKGYLNGVAFSGGAATDVDLLIDENNSSYIPGFTNGIIGKEVGSTFDVTVTFPTDYHESSLAGKEAVFTMTLHAIYDLTLTDEEVKEIMSEDEESKTYAELVEEYVTYYQESDAQTQLLQKSVFADLPESTYLFFYQEYETQYRMYAAYYGISYETLLQYVGASDEMLRNEAKSIAKEYVMVYAFAKAEGLELTDEEFEEKSKEYFDEMITSGSMTEEEKQEIIASGGYLALHVDFTMDRVYTWLLDQMLAK